MPAEIRRRRLRNGLTVLTERMPGVRSVSIGIWLKCGSRDEPKRLNGASHFLEHLVFKGTENRSARQIALEMDSIGGQMDAFTSKEYTCFYAKVLDQHLPQTVELLSDIVQRPLFDEVELEREREVVLEEIKMVDDNAEELIYDLFADWFYPRHPLGRPIQGTAESVAALSRRQLLTFFKNIYRPENMLIVAAGNVDHDALVKQVTKAFSGLKPGPGLTPRVAPRQQRRGLVTASKKELAQVHLLMGLPVFPKDERGRFALHVYNAMLGGTMSSRLFHKIREERGLVYSVYSAVNGFADNGMLAIYAGTSPQKAREVMQLIVAELADLRDSGPTADELHVAKEHLKGSLMLALESTSSRMSNLARQEIYQKRQRSLEATLKGIEQVNASRVHEMAQLVVRSGELSLAAVGRVKQLKLPKGALKI